MIFQRYFENHAAFVNRLDANGYTLWPEALCRLHYHKVLSLTEGARSGLNYSRVITGYPVSGDYSQVSAPYSMVPPLVTYSAKQVC